jgi:hypothetical protein
MQAMNQTGMCIQNQYGTTTFVTETMITKLLHEKKHENQKKRNPAAIASHET